MRCDLDGDGQDELLTAIRGSGNHGPGADPRLAVYSRLKDKWELMYERRFWHHSRGGIHGIEKRDFDGDGTADLIVDIGAHRAGKDYTSGWRVRHVLSLTPSKRDPLRGLLWFYIKLYRTTDRHGMKIGYEEYCSRVKVRDINGDGHKDVIIRYAYDRLPEYRQSYHEVDGTVGSDRSRELLCEHRFLWDDRWDRFTFDSKSYTANYYGLIDRARAMPPKEGGAFAKLIESDFNVYSWPVPTKGLRLTEAYPRLVDVYYPIAEHLLGMGRVDEAFEKFHSFLDFWGFTGRIATKAGTYTYLGKICEERFAAPAEAAKYYEEALAAGADDPELPRRIEDLKAMAARLRYRPLQAGELARVAPKDLRVIDRIAIAEGWNFIQWQSWSPDGKQILFYGGRYYPPPREGEQEKAGVYLADSDGGHVRRAGDGYKAAFFGSSKDILACWGKSTRPDTWIIGDADRAGPRLWSPGGFLKDLCPSPDTEFTVVTWRQNTGSSAQFYGPKGPPRTILDGFRYYHDCQVLGWRDPSSFVLRLKGQVKVYDAEVGEWRDEEASKLGAGHYGQWLSPTGTHIAYCGCREAWHKRLYVDKNRFLWVARSDGGEPGLLDLDMGYGISFGSREPHWSPDGTRLLVKSVGEENRCTLSVLILGRRTGKP
ncbi:MAG: hypothetical protein ACYS9X_03120 [Planctomycetota bacterium]|jgi:tetratricopeptide (TPR) repeat protein